MYSILYINMHFFSLFVVFSLWLVLIVKLYVSKNTSKRTPYADHQAARIIMIDFPPPSQWNMIDFFQMIEVELVNTDNISIGHSMLFLTAFAMLDSLFPFILCSLWANARSKLASTSHEMKRITRRSVFSPLNTPLGPDDCPKSKDLRFGNLICRAHVTNSREPLTPWFHDTESQVHGIAVRWMNTGIYIYHYICIYIYMYLVCKYKAKKTGVHVFCAILTPAIRCKQDSSTI